MHALNTSFPTAKEYSYPDFMYNVIKCLSMCDSSARVQVTYLFYLLEVVVIHSLLCRKQRRILQYLQLYVVRCSELTKRKEIRLLPKQFLVTGTCKKSYLYFNVIVHIPVNLHVQFIIYYNTLPVFHHTI